MTEVQTTWRNDTKQHADRARQGAVTASEPRPKPSRAMQSEYVWMDGELIPFAQATVHFLNPTMHYGPGVFEGIRCYATPRGPAVFRLREHLRRFVRAIRVLGVDDIGYDEDALRDAVCRTIRANRLNECHIRPLMYFDGPLGLNMDDYRPVIAIAVWEGNTYLGEEALERGVHMTVSPVARMHPDAILAKTMAMGSSFDEAIVLDPEGYVAERTGENLFLVRDGAIVTSPRATIREAITRESVLTLARDAGYPVVEERISRDQLYVADEVFVCGTAAAVVGVRAIDQRRIGPGRVGPVTGHLQQLFFSTVRGAGKRSREWLDYMVMEPLI